MSDRTPRRPIFKRVSPGEPVSASEMNKITDFLGYASTEPNKHPKKPTRAIKLMRMNEVLGQFGQEDSSEAHRRSATVQYYDETLNDFDVTSDEETKENVTDALRLIHDSGEYVWCIYLEQSGHWHPISGRSIRHAKTVQPLEGEYPGCGSNVYPIKFTRIAYDRVPGFQPVGSSYLDPTMDEEPDEYVLNLFEGSDDNPLPWIPPETDIWCYQVLQQWYTWIDLPCPTSSQSSSSSSSSSNSSSSQSSSQSASESSLSSSSLSSSSNSSSVSISLSSISISMSSSGYTCVTVVTGLSFDEETCTLTPVTSCICFPDTLGITVTAGDCS